MRGLRGRAAEEGGNLGEEGHSPMLTPPRNMRRILRNTALGTQRAAAFEPGKVGLPGPEVTSRRPQGLKGRELGLPPSLCKAGPPEGFGGQAGKCSRKGHPVTTQRQDDSTRWKMPLTPGPGLVLQQAGPHGSGSPRSRSKSKPSPATCTHRPRRAHFCLMGTPKSGYTPKLGCLGRPRAELH